MEYLNEWNYTVDRIKGLLKAKGWTIERLANAINMDNANMSRILSGTQKNMHYRTLFKIAEALNVKLSDLVR